MWYDALFYLIAMKPYKYAGYPMLIKTIELETNDDELFSKSAPLLTAASELAFHTINTSILNAEELRREGGIAVSHVNYCPKANIYPEAIFHKPSCSSMYCAYRNFLFCGRPTLK